MNKKKTERCIFTAGTVACVIVIVLMLIDSCNAQRKAKPGEYFVPPYFAWDTRIRSNRPIFRHVERPTPEQVRKLLADCEEVIERHQLETARPRKWTTADGTGKRTLPFNSLTLSHVTLVADGRTYKVPLTKLSYRDQHFVARLVAQKRVAKDYTLGQLKLTTQLSPYWYNRLSEKLILVQKMWQEELAERAADKVAAKDGEEIPAPIPTAKPAFPERTIPDDEKRNEAPAGHKP